MVKLVSGSTAMFGPLIATCAFAASGVTTHDDFDSGATIDGARWSGIASGDGGMDFVRRIQRGQLDLSSESYGTSALGVRVVDVDPIMSLSARVQIDRAISRVCDSPGYDTSVAWVLGARLFRDAAATSSTNATGDIGAYVELEKRSSRPVIGHVMAKCRLMRCLDADCSQRVDVRPPVSMGLVAEDTELRASIQWDAAADRITCVAGRQQGRIRYTSALDAHPPATGFAGLFIQHESTCPSTDAARSRRTSMQTYVDDVAYELAPRPVLPNDTCDVATTITVGTRPTVIQGTTHGYVDDYRAIQCGSVAAGPDAVFDVRLLRTSDLRISTAGSSFDTVLYLTSGGSCRSGSAGRQLACNDDSRRGFTSTLEVPNLSPGTYRVVVDGSSPTSSGPYTLTVETY